MGEYANFGGRSVKIGTCEDMYYLRADQMDKVSGGDWPANRRALDVIRFRFPFPDEDGIEPGSFEDYGRGFKIPGYTLPRDLSGDTHHAVQFTNPKGYNLCVPCPESFGVEDGPVDLPNGIRVHRNGWDGGPRITQQAFRGGVLVTLLSCGACGAHHRLDTIEDARPVIDALRAEAVRTEWNPRECKQQDRYPVGSDYRAMLDKIAQRIEDGYAVAQPA